MSDSKPKCVGLSKNIREKILACTTKDTEFVNSADLKRVLKRLDVRVSPQLEEIDFYSGDRIPDYDYIPQSVTDRFALEQRERKTRQSVPIGDILENFKGGQITFIGPAGSGKTTLLKAISQDVIQRKYKNLDEVEIVLFIKCRNFQEKNEVTPGQLLLHNVRTLDESEVQETMTFAKENPCKILFVLDSLDTLPYTLDGKQEVCGVEGKTTPPTVLWNLLSGRLIPGCRIITSSREHTIRNYEDALRAEKVIALAGLTKDSIYKIIAGYLDKKESDEILLYLETKSPSLMSLCSIPVFLVFTLIGWKIKSEDFVPSTMSGIMVLLFSSLMHSEHAHVGNIEDVINKLKDLSFDCTMEHTVVFLTSRLKVYHLDPSEVIDVAVIAPGGGLQKLLEGDDFFFFCHQSIQETLTAFHVAEMEYEEFTKFVDEYLHTPHFYVIRRILCGIMLDSEVITASRNLLQERKRLQEKQDYLIASLKDPLEFINRSSVDQLELFISFQEAKNGMKDVISSCVTEFEVSRLPLSISDIHAIGSVLHHCIQLSRLGLFNCSLTETALEVLASCLESSQVKITGICLSANKNMGINGMSAVGKIVQQCEVSELELLDCDLSCEQLQALDNSLRSAKVSVLLLSSNKSIAVGMHTLGQLVKRCCVKTLQLLFRNLTVDDLRTLKESMEDTKLTRLEVTTNINTEVDVHVIQALAIYATNHLLIMGCIKNKNLHEILDRKLENIRVKVELGLKNAGLILEDMIDHDWGRKLIDSIADKEEQLKHFKNLQLLGDKMRYTIAYFVHKIDLSNHKLQKEDIDAVWFVVNRCEFLMVLDLHDCALIKDSVADFAMNINPSVKIRRFNIAENANLSNNDRISAFKLQVSGNVTVLSWINKPVFEKGRKIYEVIGKIRKIQVISTSAGSNPSIGLVGDAMRETVTASLTEVDLSGVQLTVADMEPVEFIVNCCKKLEKLNLSNCMLPATSLIDFTKHLKPGIQIQILDITSNEDLTLDDISMMFRLKKSRIIMHLLHDYLPKKQEEREELERNESTSIHQSFRIGRKGRTIKIADCTVIFDENTFSDIATIWILVDHDSKYWPENYIGIAPMLFMAADQKFLLPVTIKLATWFKSGVSEEFTVHILHQSALHSSWNPITTLKLENEHTVVFHCQDFSWTFAGLLQKLSDKIYEFIFPKSDLSGCLYKVDQQRLKCSLLIGFYLKCETLEKKVSDKLKDTHGTRMVNFNDVTLESGDKFKVEFKSKGNDQVFFDPDTPNFEISEDFYRQKQKIISVILDSKETSTAKKGDIDICCYIYRNEVCEDKQKFIHKWEEKDVTTPGKAINFYGETKAENIFVDCKNVAQQSTGTREGNPTTTAASTSSPKSNVLKDRE